MSRTGWAALLMLALVSAGAWAGEAAEPTKQDCHALDKDKDRLKCYDQQSHYRPKDQALKKPSHDWQLRDTSSVGPTGEGDVGKKPALLQVGRTDGADFSTAKVAVYRVFSADHADSPGWNGWQPFIGASWDRDTSAKTPKDLRQVQVGVAGTIDIVSGPDGTSMLQTLRVGYKDETKAHQTGGFINAHVEVVHLPWVSDPDLPLLVPYFGLYGDSVHTDPGQAADGARFSAYAGVKMEYKLDALVKGLSLTGQGQYFHDVSSPGRNARHRFGSAGIQYDLVDPDTKSGWVPSISLTWQHGTEPVTGEGPGQKAVLGFGAKFN